MAQGGKREGAGRKPKPKAPDVVDKNAAARLLNGLLALASDRASWLKASDEIQAWVPLWFATDLRIALDTRKFLYEKRDGKAVHTVNHLHDKPIEMNVTHSLAETVSKARKRVSG